MEPFAGCGIKKLRHVLRAPLSITPIQLQQLFDVLVSLLDKTYSSPGCCTLKQATDAAALFLVCSIKI